MNDSPRIIPISQYRNMLKARQKLGKYRIERRLGSGGFANVYAAMDTIEGIRVALKIPHAAIVDKEVLKDFKNEVRLAARLEHPNVLSLRFAAFYEGEFIIVFPMGEETLSDRLQRRMALTTVLDLNQQMLEAVAYAHRSKIIHCDIKPENFILFPDNQIKLTDFGIARVALRTIKGGGTGTMGYMAPEQAMGKPSFRSDVFSLGLILHRMLSGQWGEWPFEWPMPGHARLRSRVHPDMIEVVRRSLELNPRKRFRDADQMLESFRKAKKRTLLRESARKKKTTSRRKTTARRKVA
ncbi:MAG: serine/threonine-protein kinase [Planctomycetota bacterium]|nr:serine/threonine-protein kinase [Planctomycetota bacterium]MDA1249134.1 serine/threonine-protein kinase [Planctomycetota bacterium]